MMPHIFVIYMYFVVRWRRTITVGLSKCKLIKQDVYRFINWLKIPNFWIRASLTDIHYSCRSVRSSRSEWKLWMDDFFQTGSHWPVPMYLLVSFLQVYIQVQGWFQRVFIQISLSWSWTNALRLHLDKSYKLPILYYVDGDWYVECVCVCVYTVFIHTHWQDCTPTSAFRIV